jgi:hypothetical protein
VADHERFIVGQGESGRMYLVHTHAPRFVAELFEDEDAPASPLSLSLPESGEVLANFAWSDDPAGCDMHKLRADIADFLDESDFRADRDVDAARRRGEI